MLGSRTDPAVDIRDIRVLIVDDQPDVRRCLRAALEVEGCFDVVGEAGDGREAVALAAVHEPDAVVLDVMMPMANGIDVVPDIKRARPSTYVVLFSALGKDITERAARRAGADALVDKLDSPLAVAHTLVQLCRGSQPPVLEGAPT